MSHPDTSPMKLGADALSVLLAVALARAGVPPATVALVASLGASVGEGLIQLLEEHQDGTPLETYRAELPDVVAVIAAVEREDG